MFMLIMQFFWKYIDDLMGKGLEIPVLIKLIFYVSASLLPLALPLAMLLSSIMVIGNLAENNELTALKSSGLSFLRILRPLIVLCLFISLFTFYFANFVIPVANYKWRSLIFDIQETKISMLLTPGSYSHQIDNYDIKVKSTQGNRFKDVVIHDMSNPDIIKTVRAESGTIYKADTGSAILLELNNGIAFEENSLFGTKKLDAQEGNDFPGKRYAFNSAIFKINVSGFDMKKTDDELFKNNYEMYNVFQLNEVVDSVVKSSARIHQNFIERFMLNSLFTQYKLNRPTKKVGKNKHFNSGIGNKSNTNSLPLASEATDTVSPKIPVLLLKDLNSVQLQNAYSATLSSIRAEKEAITGQKAFLDSYIRNLDAYYIEFHRKFALTVSIIVLFFIGAPLGAIVKKGGFGAPVVIAAILFMIYFVLITVGESLAEQGVTSPAFGMWISTFIMLPFAMVLMYSASNDLPVTSWSTYKRLFKRIRK